MARRLRGSGNERKKKISASEHGTTLVEAALSATLLVGIMIGVMLVTAQYPFPLSVPFVISKTVNMQSTAQMVISQ